MTTIVCTAAILCIKVATVMNELINLSLPFLSFVNHHPSYAFINKPLGPTNFPEIE